MSEQNVRLTFRGGGWVLALLAFVILAIIAWAVAPAVLRLGDHAPGDGATIESYAFDLSNTTFDDETFVAVMQHRDMSPVLKNPPILTAEELALKNFNKRKQFLVSDDLVVGVELGGETRTYPLHMLNVHEVVNDTLGGVPIVVYWNWPSGYVGVFERVVAGEEVNFGISGLSGNGVMLMYPTSDKVGGEQLFSPMLERSVTGALSQLTPITHEVTSWKDWFARHPDTTSLSPDGQFKKRYRKGDPRQYFLNDTIYFPVSEMPNDGVDPKTHVVIINTGGENVVYAIQDLVAVAGEDGEVTIDVDGKPVTITVGSAPLLAIARDALGNTLPTQRSLWFTWYANHAGSTITSPTKQ
ncbi:MAG: DUF3179 domain-containing protein [Planctomycetes bacterium]|nr:DUF3179 domain-containing protein [Planctomycetota bacterium]